MEHKQSIFKRNRVMLREHIAPEHHTQTGRVLQKQVDWLADLAGKDITAPVEKAKTVLRREEVKSDVVPYVMVDLELHPQFPLPDAADEAVEEEETPEEEVVPVWDEAREAAWQRRLEEAVAQARVEHFEEGYEQGYVAAEEALQASFDQRRAELEADVARLRDAWSDFLKQSEPLIANLAFEVVNQLLDAPLPKDVRAVSTQALAQAIEQFGEDTPIVVTLHPDDLSRIRSYGLVNDFEEMRAQIRWAPDPDMAIGDWIVQSPDAAIRRLKEEMLGQLKSRLGLLAIMKKRNNE